MKLNPDERRQLRTLQSRAESIDPVVAVHGLEGRFREDPELALDSLADRVHDAPRTASTTVSLDAPVGAGDELVVADLILEARETLKQHPDPKGPATLDWLDSEPGVLPIVAAAQNGTKLAAAREQNDRKETTLAPYSQLVYVLR
ncbi:MAG: hypothetical protein IPN34_17160 [Planctomycetes bacterium]|nr:hypothetical protein [Planctomycetota bacterium]